MKHITSWHSDRVQRQTRLARWGHYGTPVLLFPTAGGDCEECERMQLLHALGWLIEAGKIKVYSVDSIAGQAWIGGNGSSEYKAWLQNQYDGYISREVIPAIRADCQSPDIEIITAGASFGAFNAVATMCRHPWEVRAAIGMSGTYDLEPWMYGQFCDDFYFSSPLHFLPQLEDETHLGALRTRFAVLCHGRGRWETPSESFRMADAMGSKGIPNRVDEWGPEYDHDWPSWFEMLPQYLKELLGI